MEWSKEDLREKDICESCYKTAIDCCNSLLSLADERERYVVMALALTIYRMLEAIGVITKINGQERLEVHNDAR
jgi:hypothetical protein